MADLAEVWKAIADVIAADSDVLTIFGGSASGRVVYDESKAPKDFSFPFIRLLLVNDGLDTFTTGSGNYRPRLQIDIFGPRGSENEALRARLDALLWIPIKRPAGITTTNFRIREMRRTNAVRLETQLEHNGQRVVQLMTDWNLKITERT